MTWRRGAFWSNARGILRWFEMPWLSYQFWMNIPTPPHNTASLMMLLMHLCILHYHLLIGQLFIPQLRLPDAFRPHSHPRRNPYSEIPQLGPHLNGHDPSKAVFFNIRIAAGFSRISPTSLVNSIWSVSTYSKSLTSDCILKMIISIIIFIASRCLLMAGVHTDLPLEVKSNWQATTGFLSHGASSAGFFYHVTLNTLWTIELSSWVAGEVRRHNAHVTSLLTRVLWIFVYKWYLLSCVRQQVITVHFLYHQFICSEEWTTF